MPEPLTSQQLENATRMAAKVVEVFGDDWDLHYIDGSEVSCRTDYDNPFEGSYVEIFNTSQWPEGSPDSPVAEFLGASIVMVPRLIAEVERLRAEVENLKARLSSAESVMRQALADPVHETRTHLLGLYLAAAQSAQDGGDDA